MKLISNLFKGAVLFSLFFCFSACGSGDDNEEENIELAVDKTEITFTSAEADQTFNIDISGNTTWSVTTDADWLSFSATSGTEDATVTITSAENTDYSERTAIVNIYTSDPSAEIKVTQEPYDPAIDDDASNMSDYSSVELVGQMGIGWNVGNSLDATGGETSWGNPKITKQLIDSVKKAGFNSVRIPIAWSNYMDEDNDDSYAISDAGFARVKEVVDYVVDNDMFAIINIHWDGGWMQPTYAKQDYVNDRLEKIWTQIAVYFRDYDYHLLFAGTNEVMVDGDYNEPTEEYYTVQNSFNQTFVTAVRNTGGRNAYRYLVVQGFNTNITYAVKFAEIPEDKTTNRMLMEVHYYDPYNFTINSDNDNVWQWGESATDESSTDGWGNEDWLESQFQSMETNFVDKGYGVILGEYGAIYREKVDGHEVFRIDYCKKVTASALSHGMVPMVWDNGYTSDHGLGLFERNTGSQVYPDVIEAIVN